MFWGYHSRGHTRQNFWCCTSNTTLARTSTTRKFEQPDQTSQAQETRDISEADKEKVDAKPVARPEPLNRFLQRKLETAIFWRLTASALSNERYSSRNSRILLPDQRKSINGSRKLGCLVACFYFPAGCCSSKAFWGWPELRIGVEQSHNCFDRLLFFRSGIFASHMRF